MRIIFVAPSNDAKALAATSHLMHRGCSTRTVCDGHLIPLELDTDLVVVFFTTTGRFPSKHLRIMRDGEALKRGFLVPPCVPLEDLALSKVRVQLVALQAHPSDPRRDLSFHEAVDNLHYRLAGMKAPRKEGRKRKVSDYRARMRAEHAASMAGRTASGEGPHPVLLAAAHDSEPIMGSKYDLVN